MTAELVALGVGPGSTLMVHTSLSALGWVAGGEQAVIAALENANPGGTLVMPAQSWQLCDPAFLADPNVPADWWPEIRRTLPAYDKALTPTRTMGRVAELFRTLPGSERSNHPHRSIAARGPHAERIVAVHDLDQPAGERSPLRALYELDAQVLLLGVGYDKVTALHLAETRCEWPGKHTVRNGGPVIRDGVRQWLEWDEMWPEDDDFAEVGAAFEATSGLVRVGSVGAATARLAPMRELLDFAIDWIAAHRR